MKKIIILLVGSITISFQAQEGGVGINTAEPEAKIHINGTFRYEHPSADKNKVLTSDAAGNATWKALEFRPTPVPIYLNSGEGNSDYRNTTGTSKLRTTGATITLPPGDWLVFTSQFININTGISKNNLGSNDGIWVRLTLADVNSDTSSATADLLTNKLISAFVTGEPGQAVMAGEFLVRNSTLNLKTYYLKYSVQDMRFNFPIRYTVINFGSSPDGQEADGHWKENQLYAIPVN